MTGYIPFRYQRIHYPSPVTFPRVGSPSKKRPARLEQQTCSFQGGQRSDDRGRVAGDYAGALPTDRPIEGRLGYERMAGRFVLLAALQDELDASMAIALDVPGSDFLGGAVDHNVGFSEEVVKGS